MEILTNKPYTDGPGGSGQYTHKIYHVGSHLPGKTIVNMYDQKENVGKPARYTKSTLFHSVGTRVRNKTAPRPLVCRKTMS